MTLEEKYILDKGSDIFQDSLFGGEYPDSWFRGFMSDQEILDKMRFLRQVALIRARQELLEGDHDDFDEHEALGI